jgi:DinB superfamily
MTTIADGSYLERLLALIGERDTTEVLAESATRVEAVVRRLGHKGLQRRYGPGKWTGGQVLAHLADAEMVVGYRARQVLTQAAHAIQEYDESAWMSLYADVDGEAALAAFLAARQWNLHLVRGLNPAQMTRVGCHPRRGDEPLATTLRALAGHTLSHLGQLEAL